jgi:hypothetical protein
MENLRPFGIFCGHLIYFMVSWDSFSRFGMLYQEKYGNPGLCGQSRLSRKSLEEMSKILSGILNWSCPRVD